LYTGSLDPPVKTQDILFRALKSLEITGAAVAERRHELERWIREEAFSVRTNYRLGTEIK
jgi:hypothetical protein